MTKAERAKLATEALEKLYPDEKCSLEYGEEPWKLMVMGRLSAQCTDSRVNKTCKELFCVYPTLKDLAYADVKAVAEIVRPCGFHNTKSRDIVAEAKKLYEEFNGIIPRDMDTLLTFPGIGRKIANLLLGDIYGMPAIVCDTHCIRISARLGLTKKGERDPVRTEKALVPIIPPEKSADFCHRIVAFGREICTARNPSCDNCPLADLCKKQIV